MQTTAVADPALEAYEALAPFYDAYTADYDHATWLANLERLVLAQGLRGRRLLDLACGTGKSYLPLLERGYEVVACDLSPAMVQRARNNTPPGAAQLLVADMRSLPRLGEFDLITCLDDSINYLTESRELADTFAGVASNLARRGLFLFDVNSLATYRGAFARDAVADAEQALFCWRGQAEETVAEGALTSAVVEVFHEQEDGLYRRTRSRHQQRHHPRGVLARALEQSGLELLTVRGQNRGGQLDLTAEELRHRKLVYLARRRAPTGARR